MSDGLCAECNKRPYCNTLCPEAKVWADQDYRGRTEGLLPSGDTPETFPSVWDIPSRRPQMGSALNIKLTDKQRRIVEILLDNPGFSQADVAEVVGVTQRTISYHLDAIRKKIAKNGE